MSKTLQMFFTAAGLLSMAAAPADALTMQECSAKYEAAKKAGTLGEQKWNDFRKAQCGSGATAASAAKSETQSDTKADAPKTTEAAKATIPAKPDTTKQAATTSAPAVFPKAVDPKYAKETASKGRMKTCVDQYNANKATNANGGLKWIQKGGGYYSECNKALKG